MKSSNLKREDDNNTKKTSFELTDHLFFNTPAYRSAGRHGFSSYA